MLHQLLPGCECLSTVRAGEASAAIVFIHPAGTKLGHFTGVLAEHKQLGEKLATIGAYVTPHLNSQI